MTGFLDATTCTGYPLPRSNPIKGGRAPPFESDTNRQPQNVCRSSDPRRPCASRRASLVADSLRVVVHQGLAHI